ncbi:MAG: cation transporter [Muribaculaceae bacterium]|nr:cation transporter [Muribaculaceae bacterium]
MAKSARHSETNHLQPKEKLITGDRAVAIARNVTWVGFWVNAFLGVAKVLGGIFSRSSALVADGIHSFSDFFSDIIVITMVGIANKKPDGRYQFGHGRFEALATVLLSLILLIVALGIFYEGVVNIIRCIDGEILPRPGWLALIIIVVSILSKEWLYHYTRRAGEKIKSEALIANAWHHRSDSFSSVATLIGVGGSMFLGEKWRILDPVAAIVVGVFIIIVGIQLAKPALREMLGASLPKEQKRQILKALKNTPGVLSYTEFKTFKSGNDGYVMVHIKVDPEITVREAHQIATNAEHNMRVSVTDLIIHPSTHIEPYHPRRKRTDVITNPLKKITRKKP